MVGVQRNKYSNTLTKMEEVSSSESMAAFEQKNIKKKQKIQMIEKKAFPWPFFKLEGLFLRANLNHI